MDNNTIKTELLALCQLSINQRLDSIKDIINNLQQSLESETKSSAGDKHETGRAMVQLEREKAGQQLVDIQKSQHILDKINPEATSETIGLGSVVFTSGSNYFIGISSGELRVENTTFYAISSSTPIGQLLLGKRVGDEVVFRNNSFVITVIV